MPLVLAMLALLVWLGGAAPAPAAECALVATGGFDAVTVVDLASGEVTSQIPAREHTIAVAVSADGLAAYAANGDDDSVSVIDLVRGVVTVTIRVGAFPIDLAAHPDGRRLYVAERNAGRVSVVDLVAGGVVRSMPTGGGPSGIAVTADGRIGYTADFSASTVTVLDLTDDRRVTSFGVGQQPFDLALSPDETRLYVASVTSADLSVVDTATRTVVTAIPLGGFPSGVAVHPSGAFAYVSDAPEGGVTVVDLVRNEVQTSFLLAEGVTLNAASVVMTADGSSALVPDFIFGNLFDIDTSQHAVRSFYPLGSSSAQPERLAIVTLLGGCPLPPNPRLTADLTAAADEMEIDRLDALPIVGTVRIENEVITYRSRSMDLVRELSRGVYGTTPAAHPAGTAVQLIQPGDANCDARRTAADLVALTAKIAAGGAPGPCGEDVDGDQQIEPRDLTAAVAALFT